MYADDLVVFHSHRDINHASDLLNQSLAILANNLNNLHLLVAPHKCKVVVFTRKRLFFLPQTFLDGELLPLVSETKYLGLILDSNLRWKAHSYHISFFVSKWSDLLRSLAESWWGSHLSSLLQVYKAVIRAKIEYGCYFFASAHYLITKNSVLYRLVVFAPFLGR